MEGGVVGLRGLRRVGAAPSMSLEGGVVGLRGLGRVGAVPSMSLEGAWCGEGLRVRPAQAQVGEWP